MADSEHDATTLPTLVQATRVWAKIGVLSFGGPAAQIDLMQRTLVEERQWLSRQQFMNALNFCMLLPGPEAMQLATYAGWRLHGTLGGLIAGLLFILPGATLVMALAVFYVHFGQLAYVEGAFLGIRAAIIVIVLQAALRLSRRALHGPLDMMTAAAAFLGIFFLNVSFPLIVILAGILGSLTTKPATPAPRKESAVSARATTRTIALWLGLWWMPLVVLAGTDAHAILLDVGVFFSKLAVVTFGGAYAVLSYMAQDVVGTHGWLTAREMVDALGLAETTPGPLILVTQFVGFLAGFKEGGILLGLTTALVTLWVTFTPCFLWIFVGAPYLERLSNIPFLQGALRAITAAVIGAILNLSIWFAFHVLFSQVTEREFGPLLWLWPTFGTANWSAVILTGACGLMLLGLRLNILLALCVGAAMGAVVSLA